ncbi:MAG: hypothetical protein WC030_02235 [Candidatus Paceibacterota bacterium]
MNQFGWGDRIESQIVLAYRRKGAGREDKFTGPVAVIGEDRKTLTWLSRENLPLVEGRLDLTAVPVVGIGGKRKAQFGRVIDFLKANPSFQGAILLYPGTGSWDLGGGMLFVTSQEVLSGKRLSGGKPEVQLTNQRWLSDGRYVADQVLLLHGKVLETLATDVEQEATPEEIGRAIWVKLFAHPLQGALSDAYHELYKLEDRRVFLARGAGSNEARRNVAALVLEKIVEKLRGVRFVRDIPQELTVTAGEVMPDLIAQKKIILETPTFDPRTLFRGTARVSRR